MRETSGSAHEENPGPPAVQIDGVPPPGTAELRRLPILDLWRALSITLVMMGHLLPLGPKAWDLNGTTAASGMVMFFTLSGFLITRFLVEDGRLRRFLIRRLLRIVPLAWLGTLLALFVGGGTFAQTMAHLFFYTNVPPFFLLPAAGHFWSLSVEVQFYATTALLVALGGQRALLALPLLALLVTGLRITHGVEMSLVTWFRVDEILAGATVALIHEGWLGQRVRQWMSKPSIFLLLPLVFASAHPDTGPLNYARPYLSALMIGASIYNAPAWMAALSRTRPVVYVATISYALYVFHGVLMNSWLGTGDTLVKYAKRPFLIALTFVLAHLSTFHYERYWIGLSRRLTRSRPATADAPV